ncbi:MAG: hypothetical protein R2860_05570 [Desulfobacterales bacterium]
MQQRFLCLLFIPGVVYADQSGKLYVVGMGPSGADLCAPRALDVVRKADVLLCSPGMPDKFDMFGTAIDPSKIAFNPWENIMGESVRQLKTDPAAWKSAGISSDKRFRVLCGAKSPPAKPLS